MRRVGGRRRLRRLLAVPAAAAAAAASPSPVQDALAAEAADNSRWMARLQVEQVINRSGDSTRAAARATPRAGRWKEGRRGSSQNTAPQNNRARRTRAAPSAPHPPSVPSIKRVGRTSSSRPGKAWRAMPGTRSDTPVPGATLPSSMRRSLRPRAAAPRLARRSGEQRRAHTSLLIEDGGGELLTGVSVFPATAKIRGPFRAR